MWIIPSNNNLVTIKNQHLHTVFNESYFLFYLYHDIIIVLFGHIHHESKNREHWLLFEKCHFRPHNNN